MSDTLREAKIQRLAELFRELDRPVESRASRYLRTALTALFIGIAYTAYAPVGRHLPPQLNFFVHLALTAGVVILIARFWPAFRDLSFPLRIVMGVIVLAGALLVTVGLKSALRPRQTEAQKAAYAEWAAVAGRRVKRDVAWRDYLTAMKRGDLYTITHGDLKTGGDNWKILTADGTYRLMTHQEAELACAGLGAGYRLPSVDELRVAKPFPEVPRVLSFWTNQPGAAAQIAPGSSSVSAFSKTDSVEATRQVLCFRGVGGLKGAAHGAIHD